MSRRSSGSPCPVTRKHGPSATARRRCPPPERRSPPRPPKPRVRDEIGLGDDEDRRAHAEQVNDVEMFFGLRHHAVVGGDGEEHQVDAVRAREHVADEALVARNVDDARARAVGQIEMGKAEIDRDAALLFFLEAVGVLAGQRLDQAGLAVVDMAGGADDRAWHAIRRSLPVLRDRDRRGRRSSAGRGESGRP